jgi:hypothetical protein
VTLNIQLGRICDDDDDDDDIAMNVCKNLPKVMSEIRKTASLPPENRSWGLPLRKQQAAAL